MSKGNFFNKSLTATVLNYEIKKLKAKNEQELLSSNQHDEQINNRYREWMLPSLIAHINFQKQVSSVKWIGHDIDSHIYSLLYCLLYASAQSSRNAPKQSKGCQNYILLKYNMYKLASEHLKQADQKSIVELMSSAEYSSDISTFLGKNKKLEKIFTSMFYRHLRTSKEQLTEEKQIKKFLTKTKMQQISDFAKQKFPYVNFKLMENSSLEHIHFQQDGDYQIAIITITGIQVYIIEVQDCYFVVECGPKPEIHARERNRNLESHNWRGERESPQSKKRNKTEIMDERIIEENEESEDFEEICSTAKKNQAHESPERINDSFGKAFKAQESTPKFSFRSTTFDFDVQLSSNKKSGGKKKRQVTEQPDIHDFDEKQKSPRAIKSTSNLKKKTAQSPDRPHSPPSSNHPSSTSIQSLLEKMKRKHFTKKLPHWQKNLKPSLDSQRSNIIMTSQQKKRKNKLESNMMSHKYSPTLEPTNNYPNINSMPTSPNRHLFSPIDKNKIIFRYTSKNGNQ